MENGWEEALLELPLRVRLQCTNSPNVRFALARKLRPSINPSQPRPCEWIPNQAHSRRGTVKQGARQYHSAINFREMRLKDDCHCVVSQVVRRGHVKVRGF
ncbi:hypothetical protein PV04_07053 [Phialophora macrospora]|uniref:Uncharacterized protein n=1 Tax=Phialophora macrospora TaxID=1851006 RepID=A0A0D2E0D6_9EURO|nr:hypothetical protein PV04_07053 [Phialophora macrospora]